MDLYLTLLAFTTFDIWTSNQVQFTLSWFLEQEVYNVIITPLPFLFSCSHHVLLSPLGIFLLLSKASFNHGTVIFTFGLRECSPAGSENNSIFYIGIGKYKLSGFYLVSEKRFSGIIYFLPILYIIKSKMKQYFIFYFYLFLFLFLFSYNCLHFLPILPPHPSQSHLPPPPLPSPLILSLCPL